MTGTLSPAVREKLVKICARLGSDHDGERAAAGLLASRMLASEGLAWEDVIGFRSNFNEELATILRNGVWPASSPQSAPAPKPPKPQRPTQAYVDPDESRRSTRFKVELAFVRQHLHLLRPSEQTEFLNRDSGDRFMGWNPQRPSRQDMFALDILAGVIRRRMEETA
jgi:hypothetical protein